MSDNTVYTDPARRHDFVLLFDVTDGNPNGDPDAGNLPRVDPETMQGLVTDVCIKRKVRNYVQMLAQGVEGRRIYVNDQGIALNTLHEEAYNEAGIKSTGTKQKRSDVVKAREAMCKRYYDVRMFGAVMTTGVNCGQVRGPVQLTFARSVDPVFGLDLSITRVAITRPEDVEVVLAEGEDEARTGKTTEMGRKAIVPYGLYRAHGFISAPFAKQTGVSAQDLDLFWQALQNMWDLDHSAARGEMSCRGLYVFSHDNEVGRAPAHQLFERIRVERSAGTEAARRFQDYAVPVSDSELPEGITLTRLVG
jgi:CRISPR-associated protein Csd2